MRQDFNIYGQLTSITNLLFLQSQFQKNHGESKFRYTYEYDDLGRQIEAKQFVGSKDSLAKHIQNSYESRQFIYENEIENYPLLKTPSIKRWLDKMDQNQLSIIRSQIDGSIADYLMFGEVQTLMALTRSPKSLQKLYQTIEDSLGTTRISTTISEMTDLEDTAQYIPQHLRKNLPFEVYIDDGEYRRPKGMLDAYRVAVYRKSYQNPRQWLDTRSLPTRRRRKHKNCNRLPCSNTPGCAV